MSASRGGNPLLAKVSDARGKPSSKTQAFFSQPELGRSIKHFYTLPSDDFTYGMRSSSKDGGAAEGEEERKGGPPSEKEDFSCLRSDRIVVTNTKSAATRPGAEDAARFHFAQQGGGKKGSDDVSGTISISRDARRAPETASERSRCENEKHAVDRYYVWHYDQVENIRHTCTILFVCIFFL